MAKSQEEYLCKLLETIQPSFPDINLLDRVDFFHAAIQIRRQRGVELGTVAQHAFDQVFEIGQVGHFVRLLMRKLRVFRSSGEALDA